MDSQDKRKYIVNAFIRVRDEVGRLQYWTPWYDTHVEASSLAEAEQIGTLRIRSDIKETGRDLASLMIDHIVEPDGNRVQIGIWDESGFPF